MTVKNTEMRNLARLFSVRVPTRCEEDEKISRGERSLLDVERSHQGVSVHQPGASVDEGQGEEDVLQRLRPQRCPLQTETVQTHEAGQELKTQER